MNLNATLVRVGIQLGVHGLIKYTKEDMLKGFYDGGGEYAIPFTADGKFLYALIRALKPRSVLEIGTAKGGSARHICEAIAKNTRGRFLTIDINPDSTLDGIPKNIAKKAHATLVQYDAEKWLKMRIEEGTELDFDFIHEDGSHSAHLVHNIYALLPKLMPRGGVIVSHDIATGIGDEIRRGIKNAGFELPPEYVYEGSPCGFTVMKYEGLKENDNELE